MGRASHFLLTYLVNSAWQVTAICAVAALGSLLLRRTRASYRHALWLVALLLSALLPVLSLRGLSNQQPSGAAAVSDYEEPSTFQTTVLANAQASQTSEHRYRLPHMAPLHISARVGWGLGACYIAFLVYRFAALLIAARRTRALCRLASGPVTDGVLKTVVDRYSAALGLRHAPAVYLTEGIGPVTLGIRCPILLLPSSFAESASEPEMISAVCHELAHIRRHDFLLNLACELTCLPVFFHPAAILIKTRIDSSRELACDDMAAGIMSAPAVYARSLLSIAKSMSNSVPVRRLGYGQGLFDTKRMEERIMNLVGSRKLIDGRWGQVLAATTFCLLAAASLGAATFSLQVAQPAAISRANLPAVVGTQDNPANSQSVPRAALPFVQDSATSDPGQMTSIRNFTLLGGSEIPDAQAQLTQELKARLYDANFRSEIPKRVRMFYKENGYFKVMVTESSFKQAGPTAVDVTVMVNAGQQYRLEDIRFEGPHAIPESELRALFPVQPGEVFKASALETGYNAMLRLYREKGLAAKPIAAAIANESAGTVLVKVGPDGAKSISFPVQGKSALPDFRGFYRVGDGVTPPRAIYTPDPSYHPLSSAAKSGGTAIYRVGLGSDGQVKALQFLRSDNVSGGEFFPLLIQKGLETLQTWRFEPARKDGQPVPVQMNVEVNFRLY